MTTKVSQKQIKEKFLEKGLIPYLKGDEGSKDKIKCEDSEGYLYVTTYNSISSGRYPLKFYITNPYVMDNIKRWISINSKNIEILDNTYKGADAFLKCKCKIDGHEWKARWSSLHRSYGCPMCAKVVRLTLEEVKIKVKEINPNIEVIDDVYKGSESHLRCRCLIDGHEWNSMWATIRDGHGCPKCYARNQIGRNNPNWRGGVRNICKHFRKSRSIDDWKRESMEVCDWKCVISGSNKIEVHHLYNFTDILKETIIELGMDIYENTSQYTDEELFTISTKLGEKHKKYGLGVCLSKELHKEFHSIYTKYNNTPKQFLEFYKNKTGKDFDISILQNSN